MTDSAPSPSAAERRATNLSIAELLGAKWLTVSFDGEPRSKLAFSDDPTASDALEAELGRRGLGQQYLTRIAQLVEGVSHPFVWPLEAPRAWDVMSAPLSLKAQAALAVLEAKP